MADESQLTSCRTSQVKWYHVMYDSIMLYKPAFASYWIFKNELLLKCQPEPQASITVLTRWFRRAQHRLINGPLPTDHYVLSIALFSFVSSGSRLSWFALPHAYTADQGLVSLISHSGCRNLLSATLIFCIHSSFIFLASHVIMITF